MRHPCPELLEHVWINCNETQVLDIDGETMWINDNKYGCFSLGWYKMNVGPCKPKLSLQTYKERFCEKSEYCGGLDAFIGPEYLKEGRPNSNTCCILS